MHQRIPDWRSICWCSIIRKHCIWISTKGTLQFIWILSSLACVVKEGEFYYLIKKIEGRVFKFHSVMTCCVAINAKEGDCWIQLVIVYCLWCYTNVISVIRYSLPISDSQQSNLQFLPSSLGHRRQLLPSSLGHRRKHGEVSANRASLGLQKGSFHRAHSVITGNSLLTEFTRWSKDFMEFAALTELSQLT